MAQAIEVRAEWDPEARVWSAHSLNCPGLVTEAETPEALAAKLQVMAPDLLSESPDLAVQFNGQIHVVYERQDDFAFA